MQEKVRKEWVEASMDLAAAQIYNLAPVCEISPQ